PPMPSNSTREAVARLSGRRICAVAQPPSASAASIGMTKRIDNPSTRQTGFGCDPIVQHWIGPDERRLSNPALPIAPLAASFGARICGREQAMPGPSVEDQLAIQALYARYSWALDTGDTDGYCALFTADAEATEET